MASRQHKRLGSADWQALVALQATSGLSVAAFCAREKLGVASFYQWRTRLRGGAVKVPPKRTIEPGSGAFVDLGPVAIGGSRLELRLDLGGGVVLQLSRG